MGFIMLSIINFIMGFMIGFLLNDSANWAMGVVIGLWGL
jgi:hypothetical protein